MKSVVVKLSPLAAPWPPSTGVTLTPPSSIPPLRPTVQFFNSLKLQNSPLTSQYPGLINLPRKFFFSASASNGESNEGNANDDPLSKDAGGIEENGSKNNGDRIDENGGGGGGGNGNGPPRLDLKWVDLLLDPDPDNVVAVGLTGVLAWASVQVLWQLFVISIAILLAALKYSFVAALLVFILITLL